MQDLWSYDIKMGTWQQETLRGNFASARTEFASWYVMTQEIVAALIEIPKAGTRSCKWLYVDLGTTDL